jgi:hypothetical protein
MPAVRVVAPQIPLVPAYCQPRLKRSSACAGSPYRGQPGSEVPATEYQAAQHRHRQLDQPHSPRKLRLESSAHINRHDELGHASGAMTTDHQMAVMYAAQQQVIVALRGTGEVDLAGRLDRCMTARRERRGGDGWPLTCRSAACVWCRRSMIRSWWLGMQGWSAEATTSSLAIIPVRSPSGLPGAVRRLRRGLRDVRDRVARRRNRWRDVCCAGMAGGDHTALVLVSHDGVDQREVLDTLRRRWPDVALKELEQWQPAVAMLPGDAADLGRHRRGVESLRIVIMPQYDRQVASAGVEPMPVLV